MIIEELKKEIEQIKEKIFFNDKKKELEDLEKETQKPDFWQKEKSAKEINQRIFCLKNEIEQIEELGKEIEKLKERGDIEEDFDDLVFRIEGKIQKIFLSGKYDKKSAILTFQAGAGGRDAEDWTALLLRMYQRWAERKDFEVKVLYQKFGEGGGPEGRIGVREASMRIKGKFAYGFLKNENGAHRLVRISPFSAKKLRHTSFAKVEILPDIESSEITEIKIKPEELKIETFRSSGPGGQNVNRRESAIRITHIPTGLRVASQTERLQGMNRKTAMGVLTAKLLVLQNREKENELKKIKGNDVSPDFGRQIRSYVLHPYKLIKDHRTEVETSTVEKVLDGEIDEFIDAEIRIINGK